MFLIVLRLYYGLIKAPSTHVYTFVFLRVYNALRLLYYGTYYA